jgi:RNA polymerase sigma-70 factor (ECF subfamily)
MEPIDDARLIQDCREGSDTAWSQLVERFGRRVYGIAYHFTLRREDAEELSQEIFLKVFENLHRYDGRFPLAAWIVSVSRNLCIDNYRRRKREKSFVHVSDEAVLPMLAAADDPARNALQKERTKLLFEALAELPEELSEVVILRDLDGLAYEEIAAALEVPEGTVKSRLFRGRAAAARVIRERTERKGRAGVIRPLGLALALTAVAS